MVDIGNLSLSLEIPGMAALDRLEQRLAALDRQFGPPLQLNVNTSGAQQSLDEYIRVTQSGIAANRALSESELQLARDMQQAAQSRQQVVALERAAAAERVQIARVAAQQETALENERVRQAEQSARQREQIEARANQTIFQEQQRNFRQQQQLAAQAAQQQTGGGGGRGITDRIFGSIVSGASAAVGFEAARGFGMAADAVVGFNARLEQSRVAFTQLLGSQGAADRFITEMQNFAKVTPFQYEDVQKYAQRLLGVGVAAKDIIPDLTAIGNAVSATGGSVDALDHVVLALGQMRNSVHLNAQDMNQLIQANIPAWQILADKIGVTQARVRAMAESGQISGAQAAEAIISGMATRYQGMMDAQSKTFLGRLSNLKDSAQIALGQAGQPIFADLSGALDKAAAGINSEKFRTITGDIVHDLHEVVVAGEAIIGMFAKIPTPVLEAALKMGELALAIKATNAAIAFTQGVLRPIAALFAEETVATAADTVALEANTVAVLANNAARGAGAGGAAAAGGAGKLALAGSVVMPVAAGLVAGDMIANLDTMPWNKSLAATGHKAASTRDVDQMVRDMLMGGATPEEFKASAANITEQINTAIADAERNKEANRVRVLGIHIPGLDKDPQYDAEIADLRTRLKAVSDLTYDRPGQKDFVATYGEAGSKVIDEIIAKTKTGALTAEQAHASFQLLVTTFGQFIPDIAKVSAGFEAQLTPAIADHAKQFNLAVSAAEEYRAKLGEVGKMQFAGATDESILRGVLGITGTGDQATPFQQKQAQKELSDLVAAYQQAGQAINSVDITKGISAFAQQSETLRKAQDALGRSGVGNTYLDSLVSVSAAFKQITDAEDKATAAMKSFDLTLDVTKRYMSDIGGLKSEFIAALSAAEERRAAGIADQSDLDVISAAPGALAKLNDQYGKLQQIGNRNLIGKIDNLPDYAALAKYTQQIIDGFPGGARQIMFDVQSNAKIAAKEIDDIVNGKHEATIDVNLAIAAGNAVKLPAWVMTALGLAAGGGVPGGSGGIVPPNGGAVANPAGWNQYSPLSMPQYTDIVRSGALPGTTTPFDDPNMYAAVLSAAQQYGVDPRVLLAFTKAENHNATDISAGQLAAKNFAGLEFAGQAGAHPGTPFPESEQNAAGTRVYAAFDSAEAFFKALAANLSTGAYAGDYQSGNLYGVAKRYVGNDSPGRVEDYARYASQYPAGAGGAAWDDPRFSGALPSASNGLGSQIVSAGMADLGMKAFIEQCEKWVEEKVQQVTGRRGATGQNEASAATALSHAQSMGLETLTPKPGNLVYYASSPGAPDGHVAIYAGAGQQVSTEDVGGVAIHTEAVGAGAHYIRVPGVDDSTGNVADPRNIDARLTQTASIPGASAPSAADTKATAYANRLVQAFTRQTLAPYQAAVQQAFAGMDPRDISASFGQFQSVLPILDKRAQATGGPSGGPTLTDPEKAAASNAALMQGLGYLALDAKIRNDIRTNNEQLLADTEKLNGIIGGPMAANLARQYSIMNDQARIADRIATLTQRKKDLEVAHATILEQRQAADTAASRAQTLQGWADQAQDRALARRRTAEDDAWTVESRRFEDRQRALDFYGTTRQRQLQDELLALDKAHQAAANATTAGNQILSARAFGGDVSASMRLAIGRQSTKAADDAYTQQKQAINDAITAEQKLASQQRFDLETERIAAQRNHEDILRGLDRESTANSESRAARDQAHQLDLWQIEDSRAAEDRRYTGAITAIDNEITAQQNLATQADAALKTAQDALSVWQQTGVEVATAGVNLGAAYNAAVAGLSTATGVPYTQFPQPGASRSSDARTAPAPAPAAPSSANGATVNLNLGDVSLMLSDADKEEINQFIAAKLNRARAGANGRPMGVIR